MCVLVSVRVGLYLLIRLHLLLSLLLLSFASGLFPLLPCKLLCLQRSFLLGCLLEVCLFLGLLFLLLKFLLGCCGSFGAEFMQLLLFICQSHLSFLLL